MIAIIQRAMKHIHICSINDGRQSGVVILFHIQAQVIFEPLQILFIIPKDVIPVMIAVIVFIGNEYLICISRRYNIHNAISEYHFLSIMY